LPGHAFGGLSGPGPAPPAALPTRSGSVAPCNRVAHNDRMSAPLLLAGRFEILGRLGSGASGEVLEVRDRDSGRVLALKLLRPHGVTDPARLASSR